MSLDGESTSYSQLLELVILARAAVLARKGKLEQAELLLLPLANESQSQTDTFDLLAKIYAQQGRTEEARALWLRALQKEPSNTRFLRAIARCETCQRMGPKRFVLSRLTGLKVLVAVEKVSSAIFRLSQKVPSLILRVLRKAYLSLIELGLAFMEAWQVLVGKKSL